MLEIERKFLVKSDAWRKEAQEGKAYLQGYLSQDPERTIRVRTAGDRAFLTIKGLTEAASGGKARAEYEYPIPFTDAQHLLKLSLPSLIEKTRYELKTPFHTWEIDVFHGDNEGLIVAEIELLHEDEVFERPEWLGEEVTGKVKYYNVRLALEPYKTWKS
ncbi:MAG: CYTH domain-containing protein [Deinococcales bacterium]